ncbi:XRE family transcriptional regulator [Collinsella stercoris]|uniref:helix-turn-helix domain-containing protein n=1 Tax=Collinsella stercoris TaxID=147206 RepID=UPI0023F0F0F7|nr:XRE family transcriptional regulator [Collinsella stercoris]
MMGEDVAERLTEEVLQELLDAPSLDEFIDAHEFPAVTLPEFLERMLEKKGLKRSRVVRMADLNETFGYQIFTGARNPSRDKVLQIAFAMALSLRETNRALMAAGASSLDPKCRRDAIIIFCIDQGCSLQKVNEELYRLGEDMVS